MALLADPWDLFSPPPPLHPADFFASQVWLLEVNGAPAAADRLKVKIAQDLIDLCIDSRFCPDSETYNDFRLIALTEALEED
eukprot:753696-Hanusia_phi.AAC.2